MSKKKNELPEFTGPFRMLIPEYIRYKRAQGYTVHDPFVYKLREMDIFFLEMGVHEVEITREMYEAWTKPKFPEKETSTQKRQGAIRGFARYLVSLGYENIYTGYDDTRIFKRDFIPYVFTKEEINRIFGVLKHRCCTSPGYDNDTFRIAMLLYHCCGFRKAEVLDLLIKDVDLQTGKITVHNGKNNVSRIVPVSDSLLLELKAYQQKYQINAAAEDHFIHGPKSHRYTAHMLYDKFHRLLKEAGIPPKTDGTSQRLHDLRHTFCVRTLEQMQEKGFDLYVSLPLLSVYLGHKHITETEYYLRMLEEHFGSVLEKTASYSPDIFPRQDGGADDDEAE